MSVFYKLVKNISAVSDARNKYYARTVSIGTTDLNDIAEIIERRCSMTKADVYGVLSAMVDVMSEELKMGKTIRIKGLGTFKAGIRSRGVADPKDFHPSRDIKGLTMNFTPQRTRQGRHGRCYVEALHDAGIERFVGDKPKRNE